MKNNVCPKATVIRRPNFSENRICLKNLPNGPKCGLNIRHDYREVTWSDSYIQFFRKPNLSEYLPNVPKCGLNTRHDNREVTWRDSYIQFFRKPNLSEYLPNVSKCVRSVDWTHDMIIVKWHLFIWHERKLCALTNAPPVQSTQTGQWLSTLLHARRSGLCLVPSAIHLRSKLQATIIFACITIHKKDILKNFLCIWWWQMLWWKHVLSRKL